MYPASISPESLATEVGGIANLDADLILNRVLDDAKAQYSAREESLTEPVMRELERKVLLSVLDRKWREHLYEMDYLQEGIGLRAMAQRDPLVEYQREGYELFSAMMDGIKEELVGLLFHVEVNVETTDAVTPPPSMKIRCSPRARSPAIRAARSRPPGTRFTGMISAVRGGALGGASSAQTKIVRGAAANSR